VSKDAKPAFRTHGRRLDADLDAWEDYRLDQKIRRLDEQLAKHRDQIRRSKGPAQEAAKRRALQVLKQKRLYEGQRSQLYDQQFNLEQTAFTAESMKSNVDTVVAMKSAAKDMKKQMKSKHLDIDRIDKMTDDMADLMEASNEIQEALGRNYNIDAEVDEEDLMGELDALEEDILAEPERETPSYLQMEEPSYPEAPVGETSEPVEEGVREPAIAR